MKSSVDFREIESLCVSDDPLIFLLTTTPQVKMSALHTKYSSVSHNLFGGLP